MSTIFHITCYLSQYSLYLVPIFLSKPLLLLGNNQGAHFSKRTFHLPNYLLQPIFVMSSGSSGVFSLKSFIPVKLALHSSNFLSINFLSKLILFNFLWRSLLLNLCLQSKIFEHLLRVLPISLIISD